jgi:hypothetical protein
MTTANLSPNTHGRVDANRVSDHARRGTLPRHFGLRLLTVEQAIYAFMGRFVSDYDGGYWEFYELSNGGFYMAPRMAPVKFSVDSNGYAGHLSADAAGITVCLFAFGHLSFQCPSEVYSRHYYWLRDFALQHAEAREIFAAID